MPVCAGQDCTVAAGTAVTFPSGGHRGSCAWDGFLAHGASCEVACDAGHTLSGTQPSCLGGQLTYGITCTPQDCTAQVELPLNASLGSCPSEATVLHGVGCELGCEAGFTLTGSQPVCQAGAFVHSVFCEGEPCPLTAPANGNLGSCPWQEPLRHGRTCAPACNTGYHRSGADPSCSTGVLTTSAACVPDDCDTVVQMPANAGPGSCVGEQLTLDHSQSCEFVCDEGYEPVGEQPSCAAGVLTNTVECRLPPEPEPEPEPEPPEPEPEPEPLPAPWWLPSCHDPAKLRGIVSPLDVWWTECAAEPDCAGVCNGENTLDAEGGCCLASERDCMGYCGHRFSVDECGICDGSGPAVWYRDVDEDGLGDPAASVAMCENPDGHVANADDDCDGVRDCAGICNGSTEFDCWDSESATHLSGFWGDPLCGGVDGVEMRQLDSQGYCCLPFDPEHDRVWNRGKGRMDCRGLEGVCGGGAYDVDCAGVCGPRLDPMHAVDG